MVYPVQHAYIVYFGDSYNATEQWQIGFRATLTDPSTQPLQAYCDGVHAAMTTPWSNLFACRFVRWVGTKLSWIGTDGKLVPNSIVLTKFNASPVAGTENGASTTHIIPQGAHVATLLTSVPRGIGSHGRVFWPPVCSTLGNDGRITSSQATNIATQTAALITGINGVSGIGNVQVMSKKGAGFTTSVFSVRVGQVVDTQQRRRRSLPETPPAAVSV